MNIEVFWEQQKEYTAEFSKIARTLAFGAVAICWFFKSSDLTFPALIRFALLACVVFFILDTLQYFVSAVLYRHYIRRFEVQSYLEEGVIGRELDKPGWLDWPVTFAWWGKFFCLITSYFFISIELLK